MNIFLSQHDSSRDLSIYYSHSTITFLLFVPLSFSITQPSLYSFTSILHPVLSFLIISSTISISAFLPTLIPVLISFILFSTTPPPFTHYLILEFLFPFYYLIIDPSFFHNLTYYFCFLFFLYHIYFFPYPLFLLSFNSLFHILLFLFIMFFFLAHKHRRKKYLQRKTLIQTLSQSIVLKCKKNDIIKKQNRSSF